MTYETIKVEIENSLCWIGLNRNAARNAINRDMCLEITDAMQKSVENTHVQVIIIHGNGSCFSAGGDLKSGIPNPSEEVLETGHQKFNKVYEWYKVKDVTKEKHGIKMLKCLNQFNSFNAN